MDIRFAGSLVHTSFVVRLIEGAFHVLYVVRSRVLVSRERNVHHFEHLLFGFKGLIHGRNPRERTLNASSTGINMRRSL